MSFHEILIWVMAGFALLGATDRICGNRWGLGKEFEEGIQAMGSLALAMIGVVCLAPVLANFLKPIVVPVYSMLGADPAMFAGTLLACDMGGGALALEMTEDIQAAMLGGVITGSMLGATLVFTIPVAMGILKERDRPAMAKGILCGIVTIPVGVLVGGLTAKSDSHCVGCHAHCPGTVESGAGHGGRLRLFRKSCGGTGDRGVGLRCGRGVDGFCHHSRYGPDFGRFSDRRYHRHNPGRSLSAGVCADETTEKTLDGRWKMAGHQRCGSGGPHCKPCQFHCHLWPCEGYE